MCEIKAITIQSKNIKDPEGFWNAIQIWLTKPHVINRRLIGSIYISAFRITLKDHNKTVIYANISQLFTETIDSDAAIQILNSQNLSAIAVDEKEIFISLNQNRNKRIDNSVFITISKLMPRNDAIYSTGLQISILDPNSTSATFYSNLESTITSKSVCPLFPYKIELSSNTVHMSIYPPGSKNDSSAAWLATQLFPKLCNWMDNNDANNQTNKLPSLRLLQVEEYSELYQKLKLKYGIDMVKVWPESTDPAKFVYEDIAIATYLLLLWKAEREELGSSKKQSFVDLGCGNGLLVHILSLEGHPGVGIDLRKRKIWHEYPETTKLIVKSLTPSDSCLFPDTDWLIGNHSDELTPWIPVMAARSSPTCRYFVLPCCAFEFHGAKYQRKNSANSLYNEYLLYIKKVSEICGFKTEMDKMRIPSTKRVCLVGTKRTGHDANFKEYCCKIQEFIDGECKQQESGINVEQSGGNWSQNFKPRVSIEKVRNCTSLDQTLIEEIRAVVVAQLLSKKRYLTDAGLNRNWNAGAILSINDVVKAVSKNQLQQLKTECGGLQTLLKNQHIFAIRNGNVQFKYPKSVIEVTEALKKAGKHRDTGVMLQQKGCWFYSNHPDGCPLSGTICSFKH